MGRNSGPVWTELAGEEDGMTTFLGYPRSARQLAYLLSVEWGVVAPDLVLFYEVTLTHNHVSSCCLASVSEIRNPVCVSLGYRERVQRKHLLRVSSRLRDLESDGQGIFPHGKGEAFYSRGSDSQIWAANLLGV